MIKQRKKFFQRVSKNEKGITLVALVVTIVIIVILASVTITATFGENGIIKQAELVRDLASNATIAEAEEMNSLMGEYSNIMNGDGEVPEPPTDTTPPTVNIVVGETTENSITITVNAEDKESGMIDSPKYTYYIKETTEEDSAYQEKATNITDNNYTFTELTQETNYSIKVVVKEDKAGNSGEGITQASTIKTSESTVEEKLKAGDYVTYPSSQGDLACRVLYDSSSGYGVQLITSECVGNDIVLGGNTFSESKDEYNGVVSWLNTQAGKYNNSTYSTRARCVGSHPTDTSDTTTYFTSSDDYISSYNGQFKDEDTNYETDYNQMGTLGIRNTKNKYWLASRDLRPRNDVVYFCCRCISTGGGLSRENLGWFGPTTSKRINVYSVWLRPVFILKSDIKVTGGTGEFIKPYTLGG